MDHTVLLQKVREAETGQDKWALLAPVAQSEDGDIQTAVAWWKARYDFTDRKQKQLRDKYLWLLVLLVSAGRRQLGGKQLKAAYELAFTGEAFEAAFDRDAGELGRQVAQAAAFFAGTYREAPRLMGLVALGSESNGQRLDRVSQRLMEDCLWPFYKLCRTLPHSEAVFRGLWDGVVSTYPDILPYMRRRAEKHLDEDFICTVARLTESGQP